MSYKALFQLSYRPRSRTAEQDSNLQPLDPQSK